MVSAVNSPPPPPPPQQTETQLQTQHQQHQINNRDSVAPMATRVVIKYEYSHKTTTLENNKNVFPFSIPGQQGLGCSVCRGPPSKPGVFVQSTKPGGLAREAGLRPGDQVGKEFTKSIIILCKNICLQVLDCNGVSFRRLAFQDAVAQLKSSRHLDLLLRKGAGADLFPSESSG